MTPASPPPIASQAAVASGSVAQMRGRRRVVLVFAPEASDMQLRRQEEVLAPLLSGADDRDLSVVRVVGDRVEGATDGADALRKRFDAPANHFVVVLVGKDGGAKLRQGEVVGADRLAALIDAMPMRRQEMRSR